MTNEERIKADAAKTYPLTNGNDLETGKRIGYIAGATAENSREQERDTIFKDAMQQVLNVASWADDPYKSTLRKVVNNALEQWKGKEVEDDA